MFYGRSGHLDEFCHRGKRIEKRLLDYARNSYRKEFTNFPPCSYFRALPRTPSHAMSHFFHGPNHCSYGFGLGENNFVPRCFGYGPRAHRIDRFPRRHGFTTGGSYTHFEPKHLDGPCFPRRGSHPTGSKSEVQNTVKASSGHMVEY
jgi:hypothetical protein